MDRRIIWKASGATLALIALTAFACSSSRACTTAIVSAEASRTGRPMIWKQRDTSKDFNTVAHVRGEKYAFTAVFSSRTDFSRAYAGINEAGFAIANNVSYNLRPESVTGTPANGNLMADALGLCASLEEFEAFLDAKERPMNISSNFAVIDALGGAAYYEISDSAYVRFDVPAGGYLVRTNYSVSGDAERGSGYARYATIEWRMKRGARYEAGFFLDAGRSFENALEGGDAIGSRREGYLGDHDFIARKTSVSSVVIEGCVPGERADGGMMWCAVGYPPCCYAVPVWVAAGESLPQLLSGDAPASRLASTLKGKVYPLTEPGLERYADLRVLRSILPLVRKAEKEELRLGRRLDSSMRKDGFDPEAVKAFNAAADDRFDAFRKAVLRHASE